MSTKENIIEAFWNIYADKPLEKITIQELMDKAGYHRSVFYVYFRDIYDLLEQEENEIINRLSECLPQIFSSIKNNCILPDTEIHTSFEKNFPKVSVLFGTHGDLSFIFKVKRLFAQNLHAIMKLPTNDYKTNLAIEFFINGHFNALLYLYKHNDKIKLTDYLKMAIPVFNILFKQNKPKSTDKYTS